MIKIKNLYKSYKWESSNITVIYKDLNLDINKWDFVSILGTSGSWKTTLFNLISGLDDFESWELEVNTNLLSKMNHEQKTNFRWKNISFIFQQYNLIDNLTVAENIDLIIELNKLERRYDTKEILKIVWLESKIDAYPYNLSWWEQQRVAVARAFVWETPILLADEPTWNLDIENTQIIIELIKKLHNDTNNTIIMITHDLDIAKVADKIYNLENHVLVEKK
jgi:putative ABC transport system ATP-binding protein